jgi:phosphohistidine phosphatase
MELILWRHCDAEAGIPDELRRLTPRGRAQASRMARWLAPRLARECRIVVSPALRAQETAQALLQPFETVAALASGASVADVLDVAGWPDASVPTLVVGHEPTLGHVVAHLLTGEADDRALAKGGVVWLSQRADATQVVVQFDVDPDDLPA